MNRVSQWMTAAPATAGTNDSALQALEQMIDGGFRHLPVLDEGKRLVGVVSIDDLRAALPCDAKVSREPDEELRAAARDLAMTDVMTYAPRTALASDGLDDAARQLIANRIGCLPVVDASGKLVGILTETDALRALISLLPANEPPVRTGELEQLASELRGEQERLQLVTVGLDETLRDHAARRLRALEVALDRVAQRVFGRCEGCGEEIPITRLRALPEAERCIRCAGGAIHRS